MERERISHHPSVLKAYERIKADGMTNVWDRYEAQGLGRSRQEVSLVYGGNPL